MIGFSSAQRYYLYRQATDMRKSFDGLAGIVSQQMGGNVFSGDVFIFMNKTRNRMKLLVWDRSGYVIYYKRLEEGTFELPDSGSSADEAEAQGMEIRWEKLVMILEGIGLEGVKKRKRYERAA
jgi:transposase